MKLIHEIIKFLAEFSNFLEKFLLTNRILLTNLILVLSFFVLFFIFVPSTMKDMGSIAINILWFLLLLPIFSKVFSLSLATKLMLFRRPVGILMGAMVFVHMSQYFLNPNSFAVWESGFWFQNGLLSYLGFGMIALIMVMVLTLTSNNISVKELGKHWKQLHRIVYIILIFGLIHASLHKLKAGSNIYSELIASIIPFFLYFIGKILEWRKIKIDLLQYISDDSNIGNNTTS